MRMFSLLPLAMVAILLLLVGVPVFFVVLQAVFPALGEGSLQSPFGAFAAMAADPRLGPLLVNTLSVGIGVAAVSALLGISLGTLRGLFRLPLARLWDLLFLIPFLIPPYISALTWILALQTNGYVEQLFAIRLSGVLFSLPGMVAIRR